MWQSVPAASVRTMTTTGETRRAPGPAVRRALLAVPTCVALATSSIASLPVVVGEVDAVRQPLSDYAAVPGGFGLFALALGAMAVAATLLGTAVAHAGLPQVRMIRLLLGTWSAALVLVAAFPTNAPGTPPDLAAAVHRVAAAWALAVLPLAGWLTGLRARTAARWAASAPTIRGWSAATGVGGIAFLAGHLPTVLGRAPYPVLGALEHLLYLAVAGLLLILARSARLAAQPATAEPAATTRPALPAAGTRPADDRSAEAAA